MYQIQSQREYFQKFPGACPRPSRIGMFLHASFASQKVVASTILFIRTLYSYTYYLLVHDPPFENSWICPSLIPFHISDLNIFNNCNKLRFSRVTRLTLSKSVLCIIIVFGIVIIMVHNVVVNNVF